MKFLSLSFLLAANALAFPVPRPAHVVVCVLENHSYVSIIGNPAAPYINGLATSGALFTQSYAITHPSQPNYLDFYSGSNQGVTDDAVPLAHFTTPNLGRKLRNAGWNFTTFSENLPSIGYDGKSFNHYVRKHNPAANWMGILKNQIPKTTNQPFTAYPTDYNVLPTVSYVIPTTVNDMHDGTDPTRITIGDNWVKNHLDAYVQWADANNSLFILTFDEDDHSASNRIVTLFSGPMVANGQYASRINHFNVLRTIEDMYGLTYAGASATATPIDYCWK